MRILILYLILVIGHDSFGQLVDLKWKIDGDQTLVYKMSSNTSQMVETFSDKNSNPPFTFNAIGDQMQNFTVNSSGIQNNLDQILVLDKQSNGIIDVKIIVDDFSSSETNSGSQNANTELKGVQLRGLINERGKIKSFYTKREHKNLLTLLTQLPNSQVKPGETWSLDVNWIQTDETFKPGKSNKVSRVTFSEIKNEGQNEIAVLIYEIQENVSGSFILPTGQQAINSTMVFDFIGKAEFSIDQGKWLKFQGIMTYEAIDVQSSRSKQIYILEEFEGFKGDLSVYE